MNMTDSSDDGSSGHLEPWQTYQWSQIVWPNCRNLTIYGPSTPQAPPTDVLNASFLGHDDYNDMAKYARICNWICLGLIGMAVVPGLIHRWRKQQPVRSNNFFTSTVLGRTYLAFLAFFRSIGYRTASISFGKQRRRWYLPQTNHLIVILSVCIGLLAWNLSTRPYYRCLREWGAPPLSTRSSMMIVSFFPFLFVLGSKFNFISIITNISYERLQVYHQWLARFIVLLSLIHFIPMLVQPYMEGGGSLLHLYYYSTAQANYLMYWTGTACFAFLVWMVISSTSIIRNLSYEFFVLQHVLSILFFLVFFFMHTGNMLNSWNWLWPTVGLWGLAVLVRMLRGALASDFFVGRYALVETDMKNIEVDSINQEHQDPLVKITVRTPVRWAPGQHIFLHFPSLGFMQPHPFTVITLPDPDRKNFESTAIFLARARAGLTKSLNNLTQQQQRQQQQNGVATGASRRSSLEVEKEVIKEDKGQVKPAALVPVSIDGPYGSNASMASYDGVLLIAAGSGFSMIISVLQDLAIKCIREPEHVTTRKIHIFWSIRTPSTLNWMRDQLDRCVEILREKGKIDVQVQIAITRTFAEDKDTLRLPKYAQYTFGQRSSINEICSSGIDEMAKNSIRSMSCVVCGPREMGLETQNAVRRAQWKILLGKSGSLLELYLLKTNFFW